MFAFWFLPVALIFGVVSSVMHVLHEHLIENNDRILIIGGLTAFLGDISSSGFINKLRSESNNVFLNVTISNCADKNANSFDFTKELQDNCLPHYRPNKVMLVIGFYEIDSNNGDTYNARFALESTVSFLTDLGIQVIICSAEITSEFMDIVDGQSKNDLVVEEFVWLTNQVARDYGAMHIDLHGALLKYQEITTIDGLPHSFITHDDGVLSEVGHALIAQILVERLLGPVSDFVRSNVAAAGRRQVASIRDSLRLLSVSSSGGIDT